MSEPTVSPCPKCGGLAACWCPLPADPTVLEKIRKMPGCGKVGGQMPGSLQRWTHTFAVNYAKKCDACLGLLVASLSRKAREEALEEAAREAKHFWLYHEYAYIGDADALEDLCEKLAAKLRTLKEAKP